MNGPEHYKESERLNLRSEQAPDPEAAMVYIAQAQVHATLALAAAQIDVLPESVFLAAGHRNDWAKAIN